MIDVLMDPTVNLCLGLIVGTLATLTLLRRRVVRREQAALARKYRERSLRHVKVDPPLAYIEREGVDRGQ